MAASQQSLKDAMSSYFATTDDMQELQKAIQTSDITDVEDGYLIPIEYDAEILSLIYKKAPFLGRLIATNRSKPTNSALVGYRNKTSGPTSSFATETGEIPAGTDSKWTSGSAKMKTIITPLEITDMAMKGGSNVVDVYQDELADGMVDQAWTKNKQIIQGTTTIGGVADIGFAGLDSLITTNVFHKSSYSITKNDLRTACYAIANLGGTPTCILTRGEVSSQLEDELYPNVRYPAQTEMVPGYNVTAFRTPQGTDIPIITDLRYPSGRRS